MENREYKEIIVVDTERGQNVSATKRIQIYAQRIGEVLKGKAEGR